MSTISPAGRSERPFYDSQLRPHPFFEEALELWRFRELALRWSLRTIKIRYKRSVLGILWTLLEPLMITAILAVVFSALFRFDLPNYPVYVLTGVTVFDFVRRSTVGMVEEILASQSLARRIYIPRSAFAVAAIFTYLINWMLALLPLVAVMILFRHPFSWALVSVPPAMALIAVFALGIGLTVATLAAFFHDINLTYQVLLTAWMYATPIIYPLEIVPDNYRPLILINPLTHLLRLLHEPIYEGRLPQAETWLIGTAVAFAALLVGWWSFSHWRDAFDYRT